jgi:hypothetical protein
MTLLGATAIHALGWMLLHFLWQGALIAGGLRVALSALPEARARERYAPAALRSSVCCSRHQ